MIMTMKEKENPIQENNDGDCLNHDQYNKQKSTILVTLDIALDLQIEFVHTIQACDEIFNKYTTVNVVKIDMNIKLI